MSVPMTEPVATQPVTAADETKTTEAPQAGPKVETFDADYVSKLRGEAAKYRTEAKANADAAARLAAIEESNKTEAQKLTEQLAAARKEASDAKREAYAASKGVPASLVTGSTPDEWESSAVAALAWKGESPKLPVAPSSAGQGKVGDPVGAGAAQLTQDDVKRMYAEGKYDEIETARAGGRLNTLLGS